MSVSSPRTQHPGYDTNGELSESNSTSRSRHLSRDQSSESEVPNLPNSISRKSSYQAVPLVRPHTLPPVPAAPNDQESSAVKVPPETSFLEAINVFKFTSLSLENKASVARDHLANERTFLAWLRTSLSFITIGIGVTQLLRLEDKSSSVSVNGAVLILTPDDTSASIYKYGKPLGSIFIVLGIITLLFGVVRFFQVQTMLTKNYYPASRLSILILITAVLIVILVTFYMVIKSTT
ncbi:uncharacterized protein RJT21DRAFT_111533 [Scheffersomyces amazonensis]|uniref:uncharacterized protein n=1 Tax=Scheffersomyces amazonensis TaxID=1078765 RepID=UPI00315D2F13